MVWSPCFSSPPPATLVAVAFTGEEIGLVGSRFFVAHPPIPLEEIRGVFNLDMVSRGEPNLVFCEGGPSAPELRAAVERANDRVGLDIRFDAHPEWLHASDHGPFLDVGVPALYLGVEDHADYHRVTDHADRILPELAARVARLAFLAALDLASS
ncbi:MAG: M28 family peptidase [Planctomycetota bacterium]